MSLLVICEVLGVFVNTLSVDDKYFLHSSQNFPQRIEKQVSKKQKTFSQIFVPFLKLTFNFNCFFKKMTITVYVFPKLRTVKNVIRQKKKTLWPLFMDGVQLPQGYSHFEEAVYFLPLSSQKSLVLILSTSEMSTQPSLRTPFDSQHVKGSQALVKSR